jgi:hypothetical protein
MKIQFYAMAAAVAGLFAFGSAAMGQSQGNTSGPAAGSNVKPSTGQNASGVAGPAGSKNGPAARIDPASGSTADNNVKSPTGGTGGNAAGVAGPAGSKNGPPQRNSRLCEESTSAEESGYV